MNIPKNRVQNESQKQINIVIFRARKNSLLHKQRDVTLKNNFDILETQITQLLQLYSGKRL